MQRNNRTSQLNKKRIQWLFYVSLAILAVFFFIFPGEKGYVLFDDSSSYINFYSDMEGVMPVYPLFLHGSRLLFGEGSYLYAVVVEQALLASACVIIFIAVIRTKFGLQYWESYICFALALLPFTTDLPEAVTTHEILTEGIAYALFYLFAAVLLQAVWHKSWKWFGILCIMTLFLALIRSQLQILFGVCGVVCIYITVLRSGKNKKHHWLLRFLCGVAGCMLIGLLGVWTVGRISIGYQGVKAEMRRELQDGQQRQQAGGQGARDETDSEDTVLATSQYTSLIFSRGMYEADYEDYVLFEDEQVRTLYLALYPTVDRERCRYAYAEPGLWMWRDIVGGIGSVGVKCFYAQNEFYPEVYPELVHSGDYSAVRNHNQLVIGLALLKAHFGRFLYHTVMMLPQAFICTVFFQIERIYLLCHLVTLFLYLSAAALMIWAYADRKVDRAYGEFMCCVLGTNLILVLVISLVFFGQQRYLVYNFGIFYIAYFLLLMQLWRLYVRGLAVRAWNRFRRRGGTQE